jgi:hypothetical protein
MVRLKLMTGADEPCELLPNELSGATRGAPPYERKGVDNQ